MDRRTFLKVGGMASAALVTLGVTLRAVRPPVRPPVNGKSVIAVVCDDLNTQDVLPEITELVGEKGIIFNHAVTTWPVCAPSRATMFRGQMAHNHKIRFNSGPDGGLYRYRELGYEEDSLPTWLNDAGIVTHLMGKYNNPYGEDDPYVPPAWDYWYAYVGDPTNPKASNNGVVEDIPGHSLDHFADRAEGFIKEMAAASRPFFFWISPKAPHRPPEVHPSYEERFASAQVQRVENFNARAEGEPKWLVKRPLLSKTEVDAVDTEHRDRLRSLLPVRDLVGRIISTIEDPAVPLTWDDVYLVFSSDNGYHEGNHHLPSQKLTPYDEDVRIPLMVRGGGTPAGVVSNDLVANHDFPVTFAEMMGVSVPDWVDGRSFKPLLENPDLKWPRRFVGIEGWTWNQNYQKIPQIPHYRGVRSGVNAAGAVHKFVKYPYLDPPQYERYRLDQDPWEMKNLYGRNPNTDAALERAAERIFASSGAELRAAEGA